MTPRFAAYLEAKARQRRREGQAMALGMALAAVIFFVAMNWHTLVTVAAFSVAAM